MTEERYAAVEQISELEVEALERVVSLVHALVRQLADTTDTADRDGVSAEFFYELNVLRQELASRNSLEAPDTDAVVSRALAQASRLLRPATVGISEMRIAQASTVGSA